MRLVAFLIVLLLSKCNRLRLGLGLGWHWLGVGEGGLVSCLGLMFVSHACESCL